MMKKKIIFILVLMMTLSIISLASDYFVHFKVAKNNLNTHGFLIDSAYSLSAGQVTLSEEYNLDNYLSFGLGFGRVFAFSGVEILTEAFAEMSSSSLSGEMSVDIPHPLSQNQDRQLTLALEDLKYTKTSFGLSLLVKTIRVNFFTNYIGVMGAIQKGKLGLLESIQVNETIENQEFIPKITSSTSKEYNYSSWEMGLRMKNVFKIHDRFQFVLEIDYFLSSTIELSTENGDTLEIDASTFRVGGGILIYL